jgi:ribosomal protein L7/L12
MNSTGYNPPLSARDEMIRDTRAALKMLKMLRDFGVDLHEKKIMAIKHLRTQTGIGLREAKEAVEFGMELLDAA